MNIKAVRKKTMTEHIKDTMDSAKSAIYIAGSIVAVVLGFTTIQATAVKAETSAETNATNIGQLLVVIKTQNDRQISIEKSSTLHAYQLRKNDEIHLKQTKQLEHLTKITERIAAKLNVKTDD